MAGVQPGKGGQASVTNSPEHGHYVPTPHYENLSGGPLHNSYVRELPSSRGRVPGSGPVPQLAVQSGLPGRGVSPRSNANGSESVGRPGTAVGPNERRRSGNQGHHKQSSAVQGSAQHSRNNSHSNSPAHTHWSPQMSGHGHNHGQMYIDGMSHSALPIIDPYDFRSPSASTATLVNTMHSRASNSTLASTTALTSSSLANDHESIGPDADMKAAHPTVSPHKQERSQNQKPRREHGRSASKQQPEQKSVGEYALHHLFNAFVGKADFKINQCVDNVPDSVPRVEEICGPGVDTDFDALISALGHIARQKPKHLVDTIMYWRKAKSEGSQLAQAQWNQIKSAPQLFRPVQRRNTEHGSAMHSDSSPSPAAHDDPPHSSSTAIYENVIRAERKLSLSIYLICRVLIEVYQQSTLDCITSFLDDKLEDLIFDQLQRLDPDKVQASPFHHANWNIYGQLLGVMSRQNFPNVSRRFIKILQNLQDEANSKGGASKEPDSRLELIVRAMRHLSIKTYTEAQWKASSDFMYSLGKIFVSSHGQPIKHAYCQVLELLLLQIAGIPGPHLNSPRWRDFLSMLNSRLSQMVVKPRHWAEAFPLSTILLCASPSETFTSQWSSLVSSLQSKLKDRSTRSLALQAICRLMWTYLDRSVDSPATMRKLEDVVKLVLPSGKKAPISTDPMFAEPIIEFVRVIGFRYPEFCFRAIVFPLINSDLFNSGKEIKVEQLDPERIVTGIGAFLAVIGDLELPERTPPKFPSFKHGGALFEPNAEQSTFGPHSPGQPRITLNSGEGRMSKPVMASRLDDTSRDYYYRFCEILGKIIIICDNNFGGQATIDEKLGGQTPKTPISDSFSFGRREDVLGLEQRQGFYELLHTAVRALPRCQSNHIPFSSLINLLCTGTAHVQYTIAESSAESLKSIARQSHAQAVTMGFARFIFNFDVRYSTMSDEGLLGPGHIQSTLQLYLDLLKIWIDEIKQKTKTAALESPDGAHPISRGLHLDLTNTSGLVEEVESHGLFFLCSQSRQVRSYAVSVLRLVTEFDAALKRSNPRIIQILEGDLLQVIDPTDKRLTIAERSRLLKGKRKSTSQNTLIELCSSDVSYDSTLWFKAFPSMIRLSFEQCQIAVTLGRDIVCARLVQMLKVISDLADGPRAPQGPSSERSATKSQAEVVVEQWKLYLVMACTTLTNAGAQTQSQLQHARTKSKPGQNSEKSNSARSLFASVIPLLQVWRESIRDAIVTALGSININLYRTLLESLQYAVTKFNEDSKMRVGTHQRTGSSPRKNHETDRLRTEVTHVYKLTSRFLHEDEVLRDEWIVTNLIKYTDDMRIFLSDAEVQNDLDFQVLRKHYCGLLEEVFEGINRTKNQVRWMSFEGRKAAFALMEDWCGYAPNQSQIVHHKDIMQPALSHQQQTPGDAASEIQKQNLRTAALSAMASLCGGPISVVIDGRRGISLSFDVRRIMSWIDQIFSTPSDKMHIIGQRALKNLITHNVSTPKLLEHAVDMCFAAEKSKALESYFEVVSGVLTEHDDYPLPFWRVIGVVLFTLGNERSTVRTKSAKLLRIMEKREQRSSKLQDFDISVSDKTAAVYKLAQFEISKRLSKTHPELAFFIFSQFAMHYKTIHPDNQRNMIVAILPWIQVIELQLDPNLGPTSSTYMLLANLLEITTRSSTSLHNEVQALWQALATGPHGGNVQVVLDFVISLCIDRREQSFVDYARQIVVFLSSTPAGQKVVEFLLLQINPRNMVHSEKKPMEIPPDVLGLPYVADLGEALPIGSKQTGFSLGQLSLILLVDLMVAPVKLSKDQIPLLLQVCLVLWDHYTVLVQEQAREMLVHLIHELVISKIDDNTTTPKKEEIEDFVEAIRQSKPNVVWSYQENNNNKEDENEPARVPVAMNHVANQTINLFSLAYPSIHEQWAKTTLSWATSCSVRHLACRSFQIFRCILDTLDQPMLADMLARLSNTIADEAPEVQSFSMEILTTLRTIIGALEPPDLLKYPQLFWVTCACLNTVNEHEFIEILSMLDVLLSKVDLSDPAVVKLLIDATPEKWDGNFEGIMPIVYRGLKSGNALTKTLSIIKKTAAVPDGNLIGDQSRLLFGVLANIPCFLKAFDIERDPDTVETAQILCTVAETDGFQEIAMVLGAFANNRYSSRRDFLTQIMSTLRQTYFPAWELKSLIFLIGLLSNCLQWYKLNIMDILCVILPDIDTRRPEIASLGPDLISPLLRLLQTEYCPRALEVMDLIMTMNATPMDKQHLRMSMVMSGSRSLRKEYDRTQSLYGIPEDTGWSIPMPANYSNTTRANVHAVFYTCASTDPAEAKAAATPEIEFDNDEFQQGTYFPIERTETSMSEDPRAEQPPDPSQLDNASTADLVSKLDSLDDFFFDDDPDSENKYLSGYSDITVTPFNPDPDRGAALYDQQTAPILDKSLGRTASITSLHGGPYADLRGGIPAVMNPAAFTMQQHPTSALQTVLPRPPPQQSQPYQQSQPHHPLHMTRPTLHYRSVTSPSHPNPSTRGGPSGGGGGGADDGPEHVEAPLLSDGDALLAAEELLFSDDERSTAGHRDGQPVLESILRRSRSTKRLATGGGGGGGGGDGKEFRPGDLLRGQSKLRSKSQAPGSPEVPKVPEAYLMGVKGGEV